MPIGCFVCGHILENEDELKLHLTMTHKESRDYIVCQLCKAPLRDLKLHYKVKHRGIELPDGCQLRADRLYDWRPKAAIHNVVRKRMKFHQGVFQSVKNKRSVSYRSSWERQVYEILEKVDDVVVYREEPFAIPYSWNGNNKNYYPDILITFKNADNLLVEIKPKKECPDYTNLDQATKAQAVNARKWTAAHAHCKQRGWIFRIWTERKIKRLQRMKATNIHQNELCL